MKIAHVCPYDMDRPGGVQTHIRDTAKTLQALGHEVTVIAPRAQKGAAGDMGGIALYRLGRARQIGYGATNFELSLALGEDRRRLRALMQGGFDVVHYHTFWVPLLPLQAYFASRAPAVATFHDTTADTRSGRVLRAIFRSLSRIVLPLFQQVIAVSPAPLAHLGAAGRTIRILPPCTDLSRFAARGLPRQFADGRVNILFLGRLEERKGLFVLLDAYRRLCAEGLPVRLLIAGGGPEEDRLRRYVAENNVPDAVFAGSVPEADKPRWYQEADIVCAPSPYGESFGIVIAEAMASGMPVVAAANAGYRTLLTGEAVRFLAAPGDPAALHEGLGTLVRDPALRASLGRWGEKEAQRYDCRIVVPELVAIYREAILASAARESVAENA